MVKFRCYDIVWDKFDEDGNECPLGTERCVDIPDDAVLGLDGECLDDIVVDKLTEDSGWLVAGCKYEKIDIH